MPRVFSPATRVRRWGLCRALRGKLPLVEGVASVAAAAAVGTTPTVAREEVCRLSKLPADVPRVHAHLQLVATLRGQRSCSLPARQELLCGSCHDLTCSMFHGLSTCDLL